MKIGSFNNGLWCNESTTAFGAVFPSLNLGSPTNHRLLTVGEPFPTRGRMSNSAYGNKPKEFESLSLTNLIITNNNLWCFT